MRALQKISHGSLNYRALVRLSQSEESEVTNVARIGHS